MQCESLLPCSYESAAGPSPVLSSLPRFFQTYSSHLCLQLPSGFPLKFLKFTSLRLYATCSVYFSHLITRLIQSEIITLVTKAGWDLGCWKDQTERKECLLLAFYGALKTVYNGNLTCIVTEWAYPDNNNDYFDWATDLTDSTPHTIIVL